MAVRAGRGGSPESETRIVSMRGKRPISCWPTYIRAPFLRCRAARLGWPRFGGQCSCRAPIRIANATYIRAPFLRCRAARLGWPRFGGQCSCRAPIRIASTGIHRTHGEVLELHSQLDASAIRLGVLGGQLVTDRTGIHRTHGEVLELHSQLDASAIRLGVLGGQLVILLTPLRGVHRRRAVLDCSAPPHAAARRASSPSCVGLLGSSSRRCAACIVAELCWTARLLLTPLRGVHPAPGAAAGPHQRRDPSTKGKPDAQSTGGSCFLSIVLRQGQLLAHTNAATRLRKANRMHSPLEEAVFCPDQPGNQQATQSGEE